MTVEVLPTALALAKAVAMAFEYVLAWGLILAATVI